jgi:hypothetical protein
VRRTFFLVVVPLLVLSLCASSDADDPEAAALSSVEAAYETFNSGDVDTWVAIRDRGSAYATDEDQAEMMEYLAEKVTPEMEGGARYEDIQCESMGLGEWPVADAGPVDGYYFTCDTTYVDSAGEEHPEAFEWVVAEGEVIAVRSNA